MIEKAEYSIEKKITGHDILSVNYAVSSGRYKCWLDSQQVKETIGK